MVICLERGVNSWHTVHLIPPLPPHHLCFSKNPEWSILLVPVCPGCPGKNAVKRVVVVRLLWLLLSSATHGWSAHGRQHHGRIHSTADWHSDSTQTGYYYNYSLSYPILPSLFRTDSMVSCPAPFLLSISVFIF